MYETQRTDIEKCLTVKLCIFILPYIQNIYYMCSKSFNINNHS